MVRFILTVALGSVAAIAHAELIRISSHGDPDMAQIMDPQPGVFYEIKFEGRVWEFVGSFEENTAMIRGAFDPQPPRVWTDPIAPEDRFQYRLPNTSSWLIGYQWQLGVTQHGDALEGEKPLFEETNDVDIHELNLVRNFFGRVREPNRDLGSADVTYDDRVDLDDLNAVRNNYGNVPIVRWNVPEAIPEPAAAMLLALGLCCVSRRRLRFRRPRGSSHWGCAAR